MLINKISVIIPVYNGEKTIQETVESVLNQTFTDFELIIINADSTDATLSIVSQIKDERIKVFSYPKANVAVNRNRGIKHAAGDYLSFIDADDLWTSDKLAAQHKALQENPQAGVAYSWTDYIDESSQYLKSGRRVKASDDAFSKLLLFNFLENGSNPLIRKSTLEKVGGFDELLPAAQDIDMWLRLAANYKFICVEKPQILYRTSANSMSTNVKRLEAASLKVIERSFSYPKAEKLQHLKKKSISHLYQFLTFKTIEAPSQKRTTAIYYLWNSIKNYPGSIKNTKTIIIAILKILFPGLIQRASKFKKAAAM